MISLSVEGSPSGLIVDLQRDAAERQYYVFVTYGRQDALRVEQYEGVALGPCPDFAMVRRV